MNRTLIRSTERIQLGIAVLCVLLMLMLIFLPGIFPAVEQPLIDWRFGIIVVFVIMYLTSVFIAAKTARTYRSLSRDQKLIGLLPMLFCLIAALILFFYYTGCVQQYFD